MSAKTAVRARPQDHARRHRGEAAGAARRGRRAHRGGEGAGDRDRGRRRGRDDRGRVPARPAQGEEAPDRARDPADLMFESLLRRLTHHRMAPGPVRLAGLARRGGGRRRAPAPALRRARPRGGPVPHARRRRRSVRDHHESTRQAVIGRRPGAGTLGRIMKVVLRNPRRELELPAPRTVAQLLTHLDVVPESVLVIRNDTLATRDEHLARRRRRRDPPGRLRRRASSSDEVPAVPGAGGDRRPPAQRRLLRRLLHAPLPRAGAARRSKTTT